VALAGVVVFYRLTSAPDFTPAEDNYLSVVKGYPGAWPADEELVAQGHQLCDALRANPGMITEAAGYLLDNPMLQVDQGEYQVGAAIGSLCTDQAWRMVQ
jgi:hypothetical protein